MHCPNCGQDNPAGMKFCGECGSPFKRGCPQCGFENPPQFKFCGECGSPLVTQPQPVASAPSSIVSPQHLTPNTQHPISYTPKHLAERILAEREAMEARGVPDGERKTITALFADIKGSTSLIEDLDPEEARRIIDPALKLMMDAVHRYEGYVAQSMGDGIFALFGAPIAHEDHAQRALYTALLMQEESRKQAEKLRLEKGVNLQVRVGINTGEVVVRSIRKDDLHTDYVPIGHSTNVAARMENLATPGSILVSEHTHKLIDGYFECKSLGAAQVKGISEPIKIYEVLGVGPLRTKLQVAARRGLAQFVGRQRELDYLQKAFEQAKAGHGQIAGVMGEPGVGKSRLFHEFKVLVQSSFLLLETFSVSHGKAYPYLPLIDLLKNYFQLASQDDERKRREKITGKVLTLARSLEDILPYLFFLLGIAEPTSPLQQMDPQIRRKRTLEAIKRLLVRESLNQPVILIFEDLHWLDAETQAFLSLLSESIASTHILLLVNYRPEYQHQWGNKTYYTQLRLDPLGRAEAEEMLTALLEEKFSPRPLGERPVLSQVEGARVRSLEDVQPLKPFIQFILDKTEGNPFFMEEIVQELVEQGVLVRSAVGAVRRDRPPETHPTVRPLTDLHIPLTVQAVLTSRIDRLPPAEKELLQTLSVIGREFSLGLLKQVVDQSDDSLHQRLSHLRDAEFIYEQPAFPEPDYVFKHALTQEVAYNSMLVERRKVLHERAALAIETIFSNRLDDHYSELASHYGRSGNTQKAVDYLQLAGQQAVQRSANTEAVNHLTTALELLKTLPDVPERTRQELTLQIALGVSLMAIKGYAAPEAGKAYARARELSQQVGGTPQLLSILEGLVAFYLVRAELQTARELAEQILRLVQSAQDTAPQVAHAHGLLGEILLRLGQLAQARAHLEQGIICYDPQQHRPRTLHNPGTVCLSIAAFALSLLGYPDQALRRIQEALTLAQDFSHPFSLAFALHVAARIHHCRRERQAVQEQAELLIALSREQGFALREAAGIIYQGWALAEQGQEQEGIARMRQGLAAWQETGAEFNWPYFLAFLAEAYGKVGQSEEGLRLLAEALVTVNKTGDRHYEAELHRLKGELTIQQFQVSSSKFLVPSLKTRNQSITPDAQAEAEACFLKAIDIAQKQQAKSLELRATMSLARLWQRQGKRIEARQMLAEVYNWFTEGFDTKDLQEAKTLLEELERPKRQRQSGRPRRKKSSGDQLVTKKTVKGVRTKRR